jgi:hypothetical protein
MGFVVIPLAGEGMRARAKRGSAFVGHGDPKEEDPHPTLSRKRERAKKWERGLQG